MLLTITSTHTPATDLGFLLHKNPARVQTFAQSFGKAHVFYPEANDERCTAALLLDVDPVALVRGRRGTAGAPRMLEHYVNDRPYVASSFLSVAIAQVFRDALAGRSKERPELVEAALPLEVHLPDVPCNGGEEFLRRLFEPLGYDMEIGRLPLDEKFPQWGESSYYSLTLRAQCRLSDLLRHLYILIPVLDNEKHYWVGEDEIDKLLARGEGWLGSHPERDLIVHRYLRRQSHLTREAVARLTRDEALDADEVAIVQAAEEEKIEKPLSLHQHRLDLVFEILKESGAHRVLDLGCGEGRLLQTLIKERQFSEIVGMDVSYRALEIAKDKLHLERLPPTQQERIKLVQGALTYRDERLGGFDAAAVVEVIEHLDAARLSAFERVLFEFAKPKTVVLTTPNSEYNVKWETLPAGRLRHKDHRFEWTRAEFEEWANAVAARFDYSVHFRSIGPEDDLVGAPSQMAIFQINHAPLA